jgi:hypothetical protein
MASLRRSPRIAALKAQTQTQQQDEKIPVISVAVPPTQLSHNVSIKKRPTDSLDILLKSIGRKRCANKENVGFVRNFIYRANMCTPDQHELIDLYSHAARFIAAYRINLEHLFSRNPDYKQPIKTLIDPRVDAMIRESANAEFSWSDNEDDN